LAVNYREQPAVKPKPPPSIGGGLKIIRQKFFEPLYFIKGDKNKAPSEYRRRLKI
jgi:hypothetical protein